MHNRIRISIHALLAESDDHALSVTGSESQFLSTLSLRRATTSQVPTWFGMPNFYPRSPCGERPSILHKILADWDFYPRSPCGERRTTGDCCRDRQRISIHALLAESDLSLPCCTDTTSADFYPRSPCGERLWDNRHFKNFKPISIHALLAESDSMPAVIAFNIRNFYPRSPCGERLLPRCPPGSECQISIHALLAESDDDQNCASSSGPLFLSTLSLRRATLRGCRAWSRRRYFYPRSPCGERPGYCGCNPAAFGISIHALLAESDAPRTGSTYGDGQFLSTLSLRRATEPAEIHASTQQEFLSTLSLRRATA